MRRRNKSKKTDSKEKIKLQFVLLAVRTVNGKCDRLVLAVITSRDTDYRLSATQPVQPGCYGVHWHKHTYTNIQIRESTQRCKSK